MTWTRSGRRRNHDSRRKNRAKPGWTYSVETPKSWGHCEEVGETARMPSSWWPPIRGRHGPGLDGTFGLPPPGHGLGDCPGYRQARYLAGRELGIDPRGVHAFVMGEHGDSGICGLSRASIAGIDIEDWSGFHDMAQERIESEVRGAACEVIEERTYFAPAWPS